MPDLPIGTVTFPFTDVDGSVSLWERHPEEMRTDLARHDRLVAEHAERHHGSLIKGLIHPRFTITNSNAPVI